MSVKAVNFGRPLSRLVVVVGKKVSKRAVTRNRIRRRIIESLRSRWATVLPGYDIVLSVHTDVSKMAKIILQEHLEKALKRAGV